VVHWYIDTRFTDRARSAVQKGVVLMAPEVVVAEVANAAWKLTAGKEITEREGAHIVTAAPSVFARLVASASLVEGAYVIATELRHPVYDCLYLRLAELESTQVLTADRRLVEAVQGSRWQNLPLPLDHFE
jgi:predicted nucleic acid-binding protein